MEAKFNIIRNKDNGGAIVTMKIGEVTYGINQGATATGGEGRFNVTLDMLKSMVKNFGLLPGPMPVYFGHLSDEEKAKTPAAAYIKGLAVNDKELFAEIDMPPQTFAEVYLQEGWRGASMEFAKDVEAPKGVIPGWSLIGLAFTNNPALDINNLVAATNQTNTFNQYRLSLAITKTAQKELEMSEDNTQAKIEALEADIKAKESEIETLKADNAKLSAELNESTDTVRARAREATKLAVEVEALQVKLAQAETRNINKEILEVVENALELGKVTPAEVAGYADNPVKWLSNNYGEAFTVDMLEALYAKRSAVVNLTERKSSGTFEKSTNLSRSMSDALKNLGLDPAYANVTNADEARRIKLAKKTN